MNIGDTLIEDTFAEAFRMRFVRVLVTADDDDWAEIAAREASGYATSIIACDAEAGVERRLAPEETPDGRPGVAVLVFGFSTEALARSVANRVGQCILTCATTAAFDGLRESEERIPLGKHLRFFGDGFQKSKLIAGRRYKKLRASTNDAYCPTLRGRTESSLHPEANAAYEIVIDGVDEPAVAAAMAAAIRAAAGPGVPQIGAGNYGGKLGKFHFRLHEMLG